ncbi:unnamed protein product, partial [Laminaria digitata]
PTGAAVNAASRGGPTSAALDAATSGGPTSAEYAPPPPPPPLFPESLGWGAGGFLAGGAEKIPEKIPSVASANPAAAATTTDESANTTDGSVTDGFGGRRGGRSGAGSPLEAAAAAAAALEGSSREAFSLPKEPRRLWAPDDIRSSVSKLQLSRLLFSPKLSIAPPPPPAPSPPPPPTQLEVAPHLEISPQPEISPQFEIPPPQLEVPPQYASIAAALRAPQGLTPELRGDLNLPAMRGDLNPPALREDLYSPAKPWALGPGPPSGPSFWSAHPPVSAEAGDEMGSSRDRKGIGEGGGMGGVFGGD